MIHRTERRNQIHDLRLPAVRAHRQPTANDLAESGQVGNNSVQLLSTAEGHAKPGHDFIENKQRIVTLSDLPQFVEVSALGWHASHVAYHRFHDYTCSLALEFRECVFQRVVIVEGKRQSELNELFRRSLGSRNT